MDTDVLGKSLAASGDVSATPTRVRGLVIEPGSSTGSVEIKDGGSSGTSKFIINTVANGETFAVLIPANGVWCKTSAYATLTNAKATVFYG